MDTSPSAICKDKLLCARFNGAMTFQPWILGIAGPRARLHHRRLLQWSHDLSAMDTTHRRVAMVSSRACCFNGAMTFQPWIQDSRPRQLGCGSSGFNGAMTFQPWIRRPRSRAVSGGDQTSCFNGAMTFQPWIHGHRHGRACAFPFAMLQWSHDLSAMDTRSLTSMAWMRPTLASFNGAMTFQPWIPRMVQSWSARSALGTWLQWSHDLSAMDTSLCDGTLLFPSGVFARLQWSHDLSAMDTPDVICSMCPALQDHQASMEP